VSGGWAADLADKALHGEVSEASEVSEPQVRELSRARASSPPFNKSVRSVRSQPRSDTSDTRIPPPTRHSDTSDTSPPDLLDGTRFGDWLSEQSFPPLQFAVPGIVPAGFTLLAGPPKAGKSWLLLDWLLAVAMGGRALGRIPVGPPRQVLYLALEDSDRRMQSRCEQLLQGHGKLPATFAYQTRVHPHQAIATVNAFVEKYPGTALVAIDTLGRVMPPMLTGETTYQRDYRVGATLQSVADDHPGLGIVVAHHTRKTMSADFVDSVSGTNGLAGAADTIIVLSRDRNTSEGKINVTGRDIDEAEYGLISDRGCWALEGKDLAEAAQAAQERNEEDNLGGLSKSILEHFAEHPEGQRAKDLAEKFGSNAYRYLSRLHEAGKLDKVERGLYVLAKKAA
jgi:RecA-family ATPase